MESKESMMEKFYSCTQNQEETIEAFSSRQDDFFYRAVKLDALKRTDTALLKKVFHAGLKKDLKMMRLFQKTRVPRYKDFKNELGKLETDMKSDKSETKKTCKATVHADTKPEASPKVT